jgi:replicative DNA helicase
VTERPIKRDVSPGMNGGEADVRYMRAETEPQAKIPRDVAGMLPPFDLAAECCVLGKMMMSIEWLGAALDRLRPDDFHAPAHRQVFESIFDLVVHGRAPDRNTVRAWLADHDKLRFIGGEEYLTKLVLAPGIGSTTATIERVFETSLIRQAGVAGHRIAAEHYHCVGDPRGWIESSARAFADLAAMASAKVGHEAAPEIADRVFEAMNAEINPTPERRAEEKVRTGMHDLDRLMGPLKSGLGGRRQELARTGVGTTHHAEEREEARRRHRVARDERRRVDPRDGVQHRGRGFVEARNGEAVDHG